MFCEKQDHYKYYAFCEYCAIGGKDVFQVFFCDMCNRKIRISHQSHVDQVKYLNDKKFIEPLFQLKAVLGQEIQSIRQKLQKQKYNPSKFTELVNSLKKEKHPYFKLIDEKQKITDLVKNEGIMRWLLEIKFWLGGNKSSFLQFQRRLKSHVQEKIVQGDSNIKRIIHPQTKQYLPQKFTIQLSQNNIQQMVQQKIEKLKSQIVHRTKEKSIFNLVIRMFSSYNQKQCYEIDDQCIKLIEQYPDSKVLYLSRIRLNELLPRRNQEIPKILKQIIQNVDPKFESTDIFHYYTAMAEWEMIDEVQTQNQLSFFDLKNKKYYKMVDANSYIDSLNKAIAVRQKPVYYASLGLGYIVKQNYQQALRVFKQATLQLSKQNDPLDLNQFWAKVQSNSTDDDFQAIMMNLQTRTLQFVTNICKYFKKSQKYKELVQCCEELIVREPTNQNFKIQFIKSIMSYSSTLREIQGENDDNIKRAQSMIFELKKAQDAEANQLQKRLSRMRARHNYKKSNFAKASDGYERLAKETALTTASDYYNYAASVFKLFHEEQCTDDDQLKRAYDSIKKALSLKQKNVKYKKLKFFICCYMNLFDEANECFEALKRQSPNLINQNEYEMLIEYVKDNMEY